MLSDKCTMKILFSLPFSTKAASNSLSLPQTCTNMETALFNKAMVLAGRMRTVNSVLPERTVQH